MTANGKADPAPLRGVGVLVTRPSHQAEGLCTRIEANGGTAVRCPLLEIAEPGDLRTLNAILERLDGYDLAIFISPNAVERAFAYLEPRGGLPSGLALAAIGGGTLRELERRGRRVDLVPEHGFNSEALLALPSLQAMAGRRVVIFRGQGGRELLAETLRQRGAQVDYAEVYRRIKAPADAGRLREQWRRGNVDIVVVTSNESLQYLYDLMGPQGRELLIGTPLVVISARMLQLAHELGFRGSVQVAPVPSDEALVEAVRAWRQSRG